MPSSDFIDIMYSHTLLPLIDKPTRVNKDSATVIDNIFTNNIEYIQHKSGILYTDISDHFPVFSIVSEFHLRDTEGKTFYEKRVFSKYNIKKFHKKLQQIDWSCILTCNKCQDAFSLFHSQYCSKYEECFPYVKFKIGYKNRKPWLTSALKTSIKIKNKLYVKSIKMPTLHNITQYKAYRNKLHSLLRRSERQHYRKLLAANKNNLSKQWDIIKEVINKKRVRTDSDSFLINNQLITDSTVIAENFNSFYTSIGPDLAKKLPNSINDPVSYLSVRNVNSIFLKPVDSQEVKNVVMSLNNSSPGWDDITTSVVKSSIDIYVQSLTHILNLSLIQGVFPKELKIAKIIPLHESNEKNIINNYRPVSVLSVFSKIFERIMYERVYSLVNQNQLLYKFQFGFRKKYGTNTALIMLIDKIMNSLNNGDIVLGLFLDFSKAFDCVNHDILIKKLFHYGIRGNCLDWFRNYLLSRKQYVIYKGINSSKQSISCGVPQGSILGPLLFLLYINDLANISDKLFTILYADDTNIFITGKNIKELIFTLNQELKHLVEWLEANKLFLNKDKTHFMIFSLKKSVTVESEILLNNTAIKQVPSTKFLGVYIDSKLSWKDHIVYVKNKISKGIGIINKTRKYFDQNTLRTLYYSFVYPYVTYCLEVWGNANDCHLSLLFKLQKRAVQNIVSASFRAHSEPIFSQLQILPIYKIPVYNIIIYV